MDSIDPADLRRLYEPESSAKSSSVRCVSTWMFSLLILGSTVLFLIGLLVGYYVKESQHVDTDKGISHCYYGQRSDGFTQEQVDSAHENVMYLVSSEGFKTSQSEFSSHQHRTSNVDWDINAIRFIQSEFTKYGLDKVQVEDYNVVVTSPDPSNPNRLEVVSTAGEVKLNMTFDQGQRSNVNMTRRESGRGESVSGDRVYPYVSMSPSGTVQGSLVYGHYGRLTDLTAVRRSNVTIKGKILLLRLGKISVSNKLTLAARHGAVGVLLYADPEDLGGTEDRVISPDENLRAQIPHASAGKHTYTANQGGASVVPAQTISMETATLLMSTLIGPKSPVSWKGGLNTTYFLEGQHTVKLVINSVRRTEKIHHVVGIIEGDIEADRTILVGASRTGFGGRPYSSMGTVTMLELARGMAAVKQLEQWLPRRGIKFYSWGGTELSALGIEEFLQENRRILQTKAVAYLDLDLYVRRSTTLREPHLDVTTSRLLSSLVHDVSTLVPDAALPELSIRDSLSLKINIYRKSVHVPDYFHGNQDSTYLLQELGIPVFKSGFVLPDFMVKNGSLHDSEHHFRYHVAAARVMSLVILRLVDDVIIPLNVAGLTTSIDEAVLQTADHLPIKNKDYKIDDLVRLADVLLTTGNAFKDYIESLGPNQVPLEARQINDALMMLEKVLLSPSVHRQSTSLLYETDEDGRLSVFTETLRTSKSTKDWSHLRGLVDTFYHALQECINVLKFS